MVGVPDLTVPPSVALVRYSHVPQPETHHGDGGYTGRDLGYCV